MKTLLGAGLVSVLISAAAQGATTQPLIMAHRGSSYDAPENTIPAAELAWEMNADAVEFDVHLTADNRVVVIHDATTSRTSGGEVDLVVKDTPGEELRKLDYGAWKNPKYKGTQLPYLEEFVETTRPGKQMILEIKSDVDTVAPVKEILEKSGKMKQFVIITFKLPVAIAARKAFPDLEVYYLKGIDKEKKKQTGKIPPHEDDLIQLALDNNFTGLDLQHQGLTKDLVEKAHAKGLKVIAWTVDEPEDIARMAKIGVDGITTNRPDLARKTLAK